MTNPYYTPTGNPQTLARGASSLVRAEFQAMADGFALLPEPVALASNSANYLIDTGTVNAFAVAPPSGILMLAGGMSFNILAAHAVTGVASIAFSGLSNVPIPIVRPNGSQLLPNDIYAGQVFTITYNAVQRVFQYSGQSAASAASGLASGGGSMSGAFNEALGSAIPSTAIVDLQTATGNLIHITGTAAIGGFILAAGAERTLIFDDVSILFSSATLLLPGGADIATAPGDRAVVRGDAAAVYVVDYIRANGTATAGPYGMTAVISATQNWIVPPGVVKAEITAIGAGASGGAGTSGSGAGGGEGGRCIKTFSGIAGLSAAIVIGNPGEAVSGSNVAGNAGGATTVSLNGTVLTANGGAGGTAIGGLGGSASGGDINIQGSQGMDANAGILVASGGIGPWGSASHAAIGATQPAAIGYGTGGNGCYSIANRSGAGAPGVVVIKY